MSNIERGFIIPTQAKPAVPPPSERPQRREVPEIPNPLPDRDIPTRAPSTPDVIPTRTPVTVPRTPVPARG